MRRNGNRFGVSNHNLKPWHIIVVVECIEEDLYLRGELFVGEEFIGAVDINGVYISGC